jgi:hypothetical protein
MAILGHQLPSYLESCHVHLAVVLKRMVCVQVLLDGVIGQVR